MDPSVALPLVSFDPKDMHESPWMRSHDWRGRVVSVDGLALETSVPGGIADNTPWSCVARVLAWNAYARPDDETADHGWFIPDDESIGLALLTDGRYIGWTSGMDASGTGFHGDSIGGEADIFVAYSPVELLRHLGENAVEQLRFASQQSEQPLAMVLRDAWHAEATRQDLIQIARESGEFGELVEYRIDELMMRVWDATDEPLTFVHDLDRNRFVMNQLRVDLPRPRFTLPYNVEINTSLPSAMYAVTMHRRNSFLLYRHVASDIRKLHFRITSFA